MASQLHNKNISIKNIYENLINASQMKKKDDALIISMMSAFQMLQQTSDYAMDILMIIGQTATGLSLKDLKTIYPDKTNLGENLKLLEDTSLLIYDMEAENYKVQNFIKKFVDVHLEDKQEVKIKYNRMLASFYLDMMTVAKKKVNDNKLDVKDLIAKCEEQEKNITICLHYLISLKFKSIVSQYTRKSSRHQ